MKINNANELVGKDVFDTNGSTIGTIDKTWNSWNPEYPGYFFGIKPNENTKSTNFRGTNKLIPIYSDYIREITEHITLNKTIEELGRFLNKPVPCGSTTCRTDEMVEKPVYDRDHSRVGTVYTYVENNGICNSYGILIDPYLCDSWHIPYNVLMPIPINYVNSVQDTINLNKTLNELRDYWQNL